MCRHGYRVDRRRKSLQQAQSNLMKMRRMRKECRCVRVCVCACDVVSWKNHYVSLILKQLLKFYSFLLHYITLVLSSIPLYYIYFWPLWPFCNNALMQPFIRYIDCIFCGLLTSRERKKREAGAGTTVYCCYIMQVITGT